jgi:copper(I)-binding protein
VFVMMATVPLAAACATRDLTPERGPWAHEAWARSADSGATGGAYLTLINNDSVALTLLGASSDVARAVEVHETMQMGEMTHMMPHDSLTVAPGDSLRMQPGGMHIMLIDLARPLAPGDTILLTLRFSGRDSLPVRVPVRAP